MRGEKLEKEAEKFIIERYKLDKCYRVDTEETRQYMSIDVHNDYEEEYQCYLAGAEPREKWIAELIQKANERYRACQKVDDKQNKEILDLKVRIKELEKENTELKHQLRHRNCVDCSNHSSKLKMRNSELEKENKDLKALRKYEITVANADIEKLQTENAGLKAKTQWHDLRKNPEDLPTDYRDVFIFYGYGDLDNSYCIGYYSIGNKVWCENPDEDAIKLPVIAWCELPTFKE